MEVEKRWVGGVLREGSKRQREGERQRVESGGERGHEKEAREGGHWKTRNGGWEPRRERVARDREKQRVEPGGDGGHETEAREVDWVQGVRRGQKRRRSLVGDSKVNWKVWWQQAGGREQREGMSEKAEVREQRTRTKRVEDRIHRDKGRRLD